ncbi:MAG: DNA-binding LacI/PurR family transcriptional regulator [Cryomorphaceae bacterium]
MVTHLHEQLMQGRWSGVILGRDRLAREMGVNGSTIERALGPLEREGLLKSQGAGKRRQITTKHKQAQPGKRVCIILYEREDSLNNYILELQNHLHAAGHSMTFAPMTLRGIKFDVKRIATMMEEQNAEAYVIQAAPRPFLEELCKGPVPTFALFGRMAGLSIAGTGPDKLPALRDCIRSLFDNDHRSIVMLSHGELNKPMGAIEKVFLEELEKYHMPHGGYNLPSWENSPDGLRECIDPLFQITPPDAILVDDWIVYYAIQNYLVHQRGQAFREVLCICTDYHSSFGWCQPEVAHFQWDPLSVVRRVMQWVDNVAKGKEDKNQRLTKAKLIDAGSLLHT